MLAQSFSYLGNVPSLDLELENGRHIVVAFVIVDTWLVASDPTPLLKIAQMVRDRGDGDVEFRGGTSETRTTVC